MKTIDIYDKTSSGQQEVAANAAGLSMMERRVLILVNGENDIGALAKLSLCDDLDAVVKRLIELELIEQTEPTSIEVDAAPAAPATDAAEDDEYLISAREFMCNTLQTFGNKMRVADLHKTISETGDLDALKHLVKPWYHSISETPGGMYQADDLRKQVLDMMNRGEANAA